MILWPTKKNRVAVFSMYEGQHLRTRRIIFRQLNWPQSHDHCDYLRFIGNNFFVFYLSHFSHTRGGSSIYPEPFSNFHCWFSTAAAALFDSQTPTDDLAVQIVCSKTPKCQPATRNRSDQPPPLDLRSPSRLCDQWPEVVIVVTHSYCSFKEPPAE